MSAYSELLPGQGLFVGGVLLLLLLIKKRKKKKEKEEKKSESTEQPIAQRQSKPLLSSC
jgi:hypothetical protein